MLVFDGMFEFISIFALQNSMLYICRFCLFHLFMGRKNLDLTHQKQATIDMPTALQHVTHTLQPRELTSNCAQSRTTEWDENLQWHSIDVDVDMDKDYGS